MKINKEPISKKLDPPRPKKKKQGGSDILTCAIIYDTEIVLSLFLIYDHFEPRCSYKIVLIKNAHKKTCILGQPILKNLTEWLVESEKHLQLRRSLIC